MKKVTYLFDRDELFGMDYHALQAFKYTYFKLLSDNPFPISPNSGNFYEMIQYLKRKDETLPVKIGTYENITLFEAANRIASDLVIINGLIQLVEEQKEFEKATFTLRLGTTHVKNKGDFTIHTENGDLEGEAFNVAPSFLENKLRKTLDKWKKGPESSVLRYIFVNAEAFVYRENVKVDEWVRVVKVKKWEQ
ncbi:hypothetical protein [Flavobacterium tructae]|uniref:Uncharacterized protein n=1 Tax=Flavobacterium tructae TaxID=1114873 RepID=A0A1S1J1P5_9FLAO|nr:hypothetical protein [Flavobacterium tructae]OHT43415.1 hypothetical protein BHE19_19195 [Flavobacterium tructae]OXB19707.1 hypothetical protein B0A71_09660 [Flavobacterium tructae]